MTTINELKNIDGVEIISEEIIRKKFDVSEYFDYTSLKNNEWIDLTTKTVLCTEDEFVKSSLFFNEAGCYRTSYCFSDGSSESSEIEDDLEGVIELWKKK